MEGEFNLDKCYALEAAFTGKKVKHKTWKPHEFVHLKDKEFRKEDGTIVSISIFQTPFEGWGIVED